VLQSQRQLHGGATGHCEQVVNPIAEVGRFLPHEVQRENYGYFTDQEEIDIYNRMLRETDLTKVRTHATIRYAHNQQAHQLVVTWWHRIVPMRSYVKGWKISPSHYLNQDLSNIWLDKWFSVGRLQHRFEGADGSCHLKYLSACCKADGDRAGCGLG